MNDRITIILFVAYLLLLLIMVAPMTMVMKMAVVVSTVLIGMFVLKFSGSSHTGNSGGK